MLTMNEMHIWRAKLDLEGRLPADGLPIGERERAERLSSPRTRGRWVASRWALRGVLARYLEEDPAGIELRVGAHGKPALAEPCAGLRFNLSHSGGLALVAVAWGREVGVDLERVDRRRDVLKLADRVLSPAAAASVRAASPATRAVAFHRAWARREALVKCLGTGLRAPLPTARVAISSLDPGPGFAAAVAVTGDAVPPLRFFGLSAERHRRSAHWA